MVGQGLEEAMKQTGYGMGSDPTVQQSLLRIEGGQGLELGYHFLKTGDGRQGANEGVAVVLGQLLLLIASLGNGAAADLVSHRRPPRR